MGEHLIRGDYQLLKDLLLRNKNRGVILDVQYNGGGGNNLNLFLDWWATAPYKDTFTFVRLDPEFAENTLNELGNYFSQSALKHYHQALKQLKLGQEFTPAHPFSWKPDIYDFDNRYVLEHRVTKLPVALLV